MPSTEFSDWSFHHCKFLNSKLCKTATLQNTLTEEIMGYSGSNFTPTPLQLYLLYKETVPIAGDFAPPNLSSQIVDPRQQTLTARVLLRVESRIFIALWSSKLVLSSYALEEESYKVKVTIAWRGSEEM